MKMALISPAHPGAPGRAFHRLRSRLARILNVPLRGRSCSAAWGGRVRMVRLRFAHRLRPC
ncbi:hypothetical protein NITMOv2_2619 [Nitrospira moscoviensis]|uniref:Uncharacterized protein n=1 Tax=Nitrospira moscoviensis TaxID=42253 RepID=A0A0K2GEK5_NITMO|nr:hypothetical protein NITMOv2_2619 [Nitrospira moscoviensis]